MKNSGFYKTAAAYLTAAAMLSGCNLPFFKKKHYNPRPVEAKVQPLEHRVNETNSATRPFINSAKATAVLLEAIIELVKYSVTNFDAETHLKVMEDFRKPDITDSYKGMRIELCSVDVDKLNAIKKDNNKIEKILNAPFDYIERKEDTYIHEQKDIIKTLTLKKYGVIFRVIAKNKKGEEIVKNVRADVNGRWVLRETITKPWK